MEKVIFKNGALTFTDFNENLQVKTTRNVAVEDFEKFYSHHVEFDPELTVGGFMNALKPYFQKIDAQFLAWSNGFLLQHYYDQMQKPCDYNNDDITHIEFYWGVENTSYDNLKEGKKEYEFSFFPSYHGVSKKDETRYGFSLSPINKWQQYKLKINEEFTCHSFDKGFTDLFTSSHHFTLHDILRSFIYELTWNGYSENIEQMGEMLQGMSEKIDAGEAELVPLDLDELEINYLEKEYTDALVQEDYLWAERVRQQIDGIKNKKS